MKITDYIKSVNTKDSKKISASKDTQWEEQEHIYSHLRNASDFILSVKNWNFVDKVGYPADDSFCFIITASQQGCLYDWGVGGYSEECKSFYVNYGLGGIITDRESVIAWKCFTDFTENENDVTTSFLSTVTDENHISDKNCDSLSYGIVKKYDDGTYLEYKKLSTEKNGFVLYNCDGTVKSVFSEN